MTLATLALVLFITFIMIWSGLNAMIYDNRSAIISNTLAFVFNLLWLLKTLGVLEIVPAVRVVSGT